MEHSCLCSRLCLLIMLTVCGLRAFVAPQDRINERDGFGNTLTMPSSGSGVKMKVFTYDMPARYNTQAVRKDPRCLKHMFATEIYIHWHLLSSNVGTRDAEQAAWFYTPVYTNCNLTEDGLPYFQRVPQMMRSAVQYVASQWPYWNRSAGADHFFVVPHDFGACFHFQEHMAIERGILPLLQHSLLIQTFGQIGHACLKADSIIIPPYVPPAKISKHLLALETPRSIFAYFRGTVYDVRHDPSGGYYSRGVRASIWHSFRDNPLFDISEEHPKAYYEDMQRSLFCLCPLGWAPWSPRIIEAVVLGCIPVIIADEIVLPLADAVPWQELGVFVAEKDVTMLDVILTSIPSSVIMQKQKLLREPAIRQALLFLRPSQAGDAFNWILDALARKLLHGSRIYSEGAVLNWTAGPVEDLTSW